MSDSLVAYLAQATRKAVADLEAALLRLPEEKRNWSPGGEARTAADMVAECAIMNGLTELMLHRRAYPADFDFAAYARQRAELAQNWPALQSLLQDNTNRFIEAMQSLPAEDLSIEVMMPWGPMTMAQIISYPFWNMTYHEGQINYIASLLAAPKAG